MAAGVEEKREGGEKMGNGGNRMVRVEEERCKKVESESECRLNV